MTTVGLHSGPLMYLPDLWHPYSGHPNMGDFDSATRTWQFEAHLEVHVQ